MNSHASISAELATSEAAQVAAAKPSRLRVAGKFLSREPGIGSPAFIHGVSYGPFEPNQRGLPFPERDRLRADLEHIARLGFNTIRLYELPDDEVLEAAQAADLQILAGIPWIDHVDFLSTSRAKNTIRDSIRREARRLAGHPQVAAILVGNEIEKTLVRWMNPPRVLSFIEELIDIAREEAPETLLSYATYPSTEYLIPSNSDFVAFNVYLENRPAFERYVLRLQNLAGNRPLVITECGIDVATHDEAAQGDTFEWQREVLLRAGASGQVWFSYTDDWHRGGRRIEDWKFGLVDRNRHPRAVCEVVRRLPSRLEPPQPQPRISVIVCTRNGGATLPACLDSLSRLRYDHFEVLVIDDGSTDGTPGIAARYPMVRYHRQEPAGLSVARNTGARLATGEILAFTDDDCLAPPEWLNQLAHAFADGGWTAAGGPNIPPTPRNRIESVVAAAPGAPAHVLLNDVEAEHLPGCNFAVRKAALDSIGGFLPAFTTAGDDVDVCWRLREAGGRLRFVPGAMVWHHRRFTVGACLRQQRGYGRAEALLMKHHPSRFGPLGGARWKGAIYGDSSPASAHAREGSIFHGPMGFGLFQGIYAQSGSVWLDWTAGVLWIALALLCLAFQEPAAAALVIVGALTSAVIRMRRLPLAARRPWSDQLLLTWLCLLQPVVREWARLIAMIRLHARPSWHPSIPEVFSATRPLKWSLQVGSRRFWSSEGRDREAWLQALQAKLTALKIPFHIDDGWRRFDVEIPGTGFGHCWAVRSVTEYHADGQRLTRIALLLRWSKRLTVVLAGLAAAVTALTGTPGTLFVLSVLGLMVLGLGWERRKWLHLTDETAQISGMQRVSE